MNIYKAIIVFYLVTVFAYLRTLQLPSKIDDQNKFANLKQIGQTSTSSSSSLIPVSTKKSPFLQSSRRKLPVKQKWVIKEHRTPSPKHEILSSDVEEFSKETADSPLKTAVFDGKNESQFSESNTKSSNLGIKESFQKLYFPSPKILLKSRKKEKITGITEPHFGKQTSFPTVVNKDTDDSRSLEGEIDGGLWSPASSPRRELYWKKKDDTIFNHKVFDPMDQLAKITIEQPHEPNLSSKMKENESQKSKIPEFSKQEVHGRNRPTFFNSTDTGQTYKEALLRNTRTISSTNTPPSKQHWRDQGVNINPAGELLLPPEHCQHALDLVSRQIRENLSRFNLSHSITSSGLGIVESFEKKFGYFTSSSEQVVENIEEPLSNSSQSNQGSGKKEEPALQGTASSLGNEHDKEREVSQKSKIEGTSIHTRKGKEKVFNTSKPKSNYAPHDEIILIVPSSDGVNIMAELKRMKLDFPFSKRHFEVFLSGAVLIRCKSPEEAEYLRNIIPESNSFKIKPKKSFPCSIRIHKVPGDMTESEITQVVFSKYNETPIRVQFLPCPDNRRKDLKLVRMDVKPSLLKKMTESPKIDIRGCEFLIDTSIAVMRCPRCRRLGHGSKHCSATPRPPPSRLEPCVDCTHFDERNKIGGPRRERFLRDVNHATGSKTCPSKKYFEEKWKRHQLESHYSEEEDENSDEN